MSTALDLITRVRGVRGAMLVSADDGIVVAEQLMEEIGRASCRERVFRTV